MVFRGFGRFSEAFRDFSEVLSETMAKTKTMVLVSALATGVVRKRGRTD